MRCDTPLATERRSRRASGVPDFHPKCTSGEAFRASIGATERPHCHDGTWSADVVVDGEAVYAVRGVHDIGCFAQNTHKRTESNTHARPLGALPRLVARAASCLLVVRLNEVGGRSQLRVQMTSPVKYKHQGVSKEGTARPIIRPAAGQTTAFAIAKFHAAQLDSVKGHAGAVAIRYYEIDLKRARELNLDPDLFGRWVGGKRYFRRRTKHQGQPLMPNTYPAFVPPAGAATLEANRVVGGMESTPTAAGLPSNLSLGMRLAGAIQPLEGGKRDYQHGGVDPLHPPGVLVPVKVGGVATGVSLMPLVNFGPRELLRYNFRETIHEEADWEAAIALSEQLKLEAPRQAKQVGDTWGDYGGSHESLNFVQPAKDSDARVGKLTYGSLQKDDLAHTDLSLRRRIFDTSGKCVGHRELVDSEPIYLEWLVRLLFSLCECQLELFYPIAVLLIGPRTLPHCDSFYGGQPNVARIYREGGSLCVDYTIPFRQCVVKFGEDLFVPMGLYHKKGMVLKMLELRRDGSARYTTAYSYEWLRSEEVSILGYLPYLVLQSNSTSKVRQPQGQSQVVETHNMVGVVPLYDPYHPESSLLYSSNEATYLSSLEIIAAALACPIRPPEIHVTGIRKYSWADKWFVFNGWQFPHWWEGDPMIPRVNLFSRPMRQVPAGSNTLSEEAKAACIRWYCSGHTFVGQSVRLYSAELPEQGMSAALDGATGRIVKWAPPVDQGDEALFHVKVDGVSPFEELGMGVDLEEHEAVIAMGSVRGNVRSHAMCLRRKGKETV